VVDHSAQRDRLLSARLRVPGHVVYRSFPDETVMLNLRTGKYHGLNATAREMLDALERANSVGAALAELTQRFDAPPDQVEHDLRELCAALLERQLVELDGSPA
jgi:Coenzyme PQQ synthesis protein D (PqqD)